MTFQLGQLVESKGRWLKVSELDLEVLPRMRKYLIGVAQRAQTVFYGEMKADLDLPHPSNGLGRLLDLLSADCIRRNEPSLAAVVVARATGEVGAAFTGDPETERVDLREYWKGRTT
ncbi:hypothetical protein [Williamsia herbipolensis]|uniref:hypothetical protein n=1 Tax=Williamsia herbipolensis TaxID=1603258 RepID=UPI0005F7CCF9|nr:hypothetical protein [Williamsia herbipolensis]